MTSEKPTGSLIILVGPSGSGKGTVIGLLRQKEKNIFLSVSATTRPPRPGELNGVSYYFLQKDAFEQMIREDKLLEYACYCGNYYGTPKAPVFERLDRGEHVLLEIETQGARQIKEKYPDALTVFLTPPSMEELRRRLTGRGTESPEAIARRMETAEQEMKYAPECDHVVVNDTPDRAVDEILQILHRRENEKTSK